MQKQILQAIFNSNLQLLQQYLNRISTFLEIKKNLTENDYNTLLSHIEVICLRQHQPYQIQTSTLYVFFGKGHLIPRRQISKIASKKYSSFRNHMDPITNNWKDKKYLRISNQFNNIEINSLDIFYQYTFLFGSATYGYIFPTTQQCFLMYISASKLSDRIINILKDKYTQKIKFLKSFKVLQNLTKNQLQYQIQKFQYHQFVFNEYLYCLKDRDAKIFFIKNGEIQVKLRNNKMKSGYIIKGPNIFGYEKISDNEIARCITERLQAIIKEDIPENDYQQNFQYQSKAQSSLLSTLKSHFYARNSTNQVSQDKQNLLKFEKELSAKKISKIKQHFSNTINVKYDLFSQKKINFLNKIVNPKVDTVLYEMKALESRMPVMTTINTKLKQIRLNKLAKLKQTLQKQKEQSPIISLYNSFVKEGKQEQIQKNIRQHINKYLSQKLSKNNRFQQRYESI